MAVPRPRRDSEEKLLQRIADYYDLRTDEIIGISRIHRYVRARNMFVWALRQKGYSYTELGTLVGRDHATVLYGVRNVEGETYAIDRGVIRTILDDIARTTGDLTQPIYPQPPTTDPASPHDPKTDPEG